MQDYYTNFQCIHTSRKLAYGPGSVGPSVPVAQPGLANRDQCWSRLVHEPGPMLVHLASSGWAWGRLIGPGS